SNLEKAHKEYSAQLALQEADSQSAVASLTGKTDSGQKASSAGSISARDALIKLLDENPSPDLVFEKMEEEARLIHEEDEKDLAAKTIVLGEFLDPEQEEFKQAHAALEEAKEIATTSSLDWVAIST